MSKSSPDHDNLRTLIIETITLLCKNGLKFQSEFCVEGLLGITLDRDQVFLVSIKETVKSILEQQQQAAAAAAESQPEHCSLSDTDPKSKESLRRAARRKRKRRAEHSYREKDSNSRKSSHFAKERDYSDDYSDESLNASDLENSSTSPAKRHQGGNIGVVKQERQDDVIVIKEETETFDEISGFNSSALAGSVDNPYANYQDSSGQFVMGEFYDTSTATSEQLLSNPSSKNSNYSNYQSSIAGAGDVNGSVSSWDGTVERKKPSADLNSSQKSSSKSCKICGKLYSCQSAVSRHMFQAHLKRTYNCNLCTKRFNYGHSIKQHLELDHGYNGDWHDNATVETEQHSDFV